MHVPSLVMKHSHYSACLCPVVPLPACTWFKRSLASSYCIPAIILHMISLVSVCLALVFCVFLWRRWRVCDNTEVFLYGVSFLLCDCGWQNALQWTGWKESLRWGQNTLSLLLVMCPIIKHLIYWQASTITEGLSPPLSALWCSSFLRLNLLDEGKKGKKGEGGGKEAFGFLPSVTSSNPAPLGLSVTQLPWQPEQTGNRGPDQPHFGTVYSNIYCHPENEHNTGEQRQQCSALWVMSVLTKTQGNVAAVRKSVLFDNLTWRCHKAFLIPKFWLCWLVEQKSSCMCDLNGLEHL